MGTICSVAATLFILNVKTMYLFIYLAASVLGCSMWAGILIVACGIF